MAYVELTPLQKNSVPAKTTSLLTDVGTEVEVDDQSVFYRGGSLLTKGWVLGPDNSVDSYTEEITVSATDDVTGEGAVTISARAIKADGTNGAAREWPIGTTIKNTYTTSTHDQIKDNFVEHATLITARATKTTATQSVYVDKAATGAGTGVDWTNAFTTIQAAITSLPTVLEHAVTIYIRKGATAYQETVVIQKTIGAGSLTIRGEYYWVGTCAAAATPSTTKFNCTAADGANIAAGDKIMVKDGIAGYIITTVAATTDKGSNVWEIEITAALPTGNIGTACYYTIVKTELTNSSTAGVGIYTTGVTTVASVIGLYISTYVYGVEAYGRSKLSVSAIITNNITKSAYCENATLIVYSSYLSSGITIKQKGFAEVGSYGSNVNGNISHGPISYQIGCNGFVSGTIIDSGTDGVLVSDGSQVIIGFLNITSGVTVGLHATGNSVLSSWGTITNNATTPKTPATSADASYIP